MRKQNHYLEYLFCHLLIVFFIGRLMFVAYNRHIDTFSFGDVVHACWTGFASHDIFIVALLLALPWLVGLCVLRWQTLPLRRLLTPYYILMGFCVGVLISADAVLYEFWQLKLNAVVLSYAASPEGTTNSVSMAFLFTRALGCLAMILLLAIPCIMLTPKKLCVDGLTRVWFRNISIIWTFLLVVLFSFVRVGDVYSSRVSLFINHAAVNPVYGFFSSFSLSDDYTDEFNYLDEAECAESFSGLYPNETEDLTDTLLTTQRPNVLIVFMESFGGKFVQELGGVPNVSPNISRLIPEGVFWDNYYSNSFRTDRGTVSAYSGYISYPTVTLMKEAQMHVSLPSLAHSLTQQGYGTSYLYAGEMTNMNKREYLLHADFQTLYDYTAFSQDELTGSWGADDDISARKAYQLIAQKDSTEQWFMAYQTLSSHEPWIVPYHRLQDEKLNAFAFTDQCVGDLIDSLRTLPAWDNLLVILIPDHGFLYEQTYEDPEFFHSPMLWLGGAIRKPTCIHTLMNQSDLAATLLSQMGIPHKEYHWSRNVLSKNYTYPFVYCNFPAGIMFKDSTGVSIFDISADEAIREIPADEGERIRKAQSILQTSYDLLDELR